MSQANQIVETDKGSRWTTKDLHTRLQILEIVTFLSLVLNLSLWYFAGNINAKVENQPVVQTQR